MSKYINLKKFTANALVGIILASSIVVESKNNSAIAGSCSNNGHGNNGDIEIILPSGLKVLLEKFDPSNPGNGNKIERVIEDSNPGISNSNVNIAKDIILAGNYDYENKPKSGNDSDCDGINDEIEVGSDFNNPRDTDGDGIPDFMDTDSDNDGISDSEEGTGDSDGDGVANYLDNSDDSVSSTLSDTVTDLAPESITLTGTIRDFKADHQPGGHPDFEYKIATEKDIVTNTLGADKKPVYAHGDEGTKTTNGKSYFDQWYRDVPGVNQSIEHSITLNRQSDGTYRYSNNDFFPINGQLFGNYQNNKNFHFTYELHTSFTYKGGETFTFSGDDDVWVYINGKRVIDLGGVHSSQTQSVNLDSLGLTPGETYDLDFFFAERHTTQSNFTITTSLELETSPNPDADDDGDGISNALEGFEDETDSDGDGTPDYQDDDSDNNDIPDEDEVGTPISPSDSDNDGIPNFQDDDDDGNGILDIDEIGNNPNNPTNTDKTDLPDYQDTDDDNDGILDIDEGTEDSSLDDDNIPNHQDEDSDGDGILDIDEGTEDVDGDGNPNFLDLDSDGDGIDDVDENNADSDGDGKPDVKLNNLPEDGTIEDVDGDGIPNYLDTDSDDDGFADIQDPNPYIKDYAD